MEKRGSDEAGSAALGVVAFCFAFSYKARLGQAENKKDASARGPSAARFKSLRLKPELEERTSGSPTCRLQIFLRILTRP